MWLQQAGGHANARAGGSGAEQTVPGLEIGLACEELVTSEMQ